MNYGERKRKTLMILYSHRRRSPEASYLYRYLEEHSAEYPFDIIAVEDKTEPATLFYTWGKPDLLYFGFGRQLNPDIYRKYLADSDIPAVSEMGDIEEFVKYSGDTATALKSVVFQIPHGWRGYNKLKLLNAKGINIEYIPWSIDPTVYGGNTKKDISLSLICTITPEWKYHRKRIDVLSEILTMKESKNFVFGNHYGGSYRDILRRSKIFIVDTSMRGGWSQKYSQAASAGCLLLGEKPYDPKNILVDGVSFVEADETNIVEKIRYYLKHPRIMKRIAEEGRKRVNAEFNREKVSKLFVNAMKKYM